MRPKIKQPHHAASLRSMSNQMLTGETVGIAPVLEWQDAAFGGRDSSRF
jgi:hypothetical protein